MIIWLKFSDSLCGVTAIHGGTVDGVINVDDVIGPGTEAWLCEHLVDTGYGENLPIDVLAYLGRLGWRLSPTHDRDNGYVSATAFSKV
jgi:hypothetical protein